MNRRQFLKALGIIALSPVIPFEFFRDKIQSKLLIKPESDFQAFPYDGLFDEVRIYNKAITTAEARALYKEYLINWNTWREMSGFPSMTSEEIVNELER